VGWIIGPAVGGFLWASVGMRSPFALGAIVLVFAVVLVQAGFRQAAPKLAIPASSGVKPRDLTGS
jgi:predicted MFS family arabinose efflux permease